MNSTFNNTSGTVSSVFAIGAGKLTNSIRHFIFAATTNATDVVATDERGEVLSLKGVEFYDIKVVARNSIGQIVAKEFRGTIDGSTITSIEQVFQEQFTANVTLSVVDSVLQLTCVQTGSQTKYSISGTLTRVDG